MVLYDGNYFTVSSDVFDGDIKAWCHYKGSLKEYLLQISEYQYMRR